MKFNRIFMLFLFLFGLINLFSFIDTPLIGFFYVMKLISFVGLILFLILPTLKSQVSISKSNLPILIIIYIWSLATTPSLFLLSDSITNGLMLIIGYLALGIFAFIALPNRFDTLEDYIKINKTWFLSIAIALSIAIGLSLAGITQKFYIDLYSNRIRYTFSFINPNFLGSFCYVAVLILLKNFVLRKLKWNKLVTTIIFLIAVLYILILTDSRTPLYALIMWGIVYILLNVIRNSKLRIIFSSLFVIFLLLFLVNISLDFQTIDKLLSYRLTNWTNAIQTITGIEWLFGKGLGTLASDLGVGTYDNSYISVFIQSGLLGLGGMFLFILSITIKILRIDNHKHKSIAIATLLSWMTYSIFEGSFFSTGNLASIYIWSDLGILLALNRTKKNKGTIN